jgi:hypothetical protein
VADEEMAVDGRRVAAHKRHPDRGPKCVHEPVVAIGWPPIGQLRGHKGVMASAYCCDNRECQADMAAWAYNITGRVPVRSTLPPAS